MPTKSHPHTLTIAQLRKAGACAASLEDLEAIFGPSVVITEDLCVTHATACDWDWAAQRLLSAPARAEYDRVTAPAWAEYDRVTAPARAEYDRARAAAWAEYDRVTAPARAEYDRARAAAWAEYDRVTAPARAEYDRARAAKFASLWLSERS